MCTLASMCTLAVVQYLKYKKKQQLTTAAIYVVAAHVYAPGAVIKITDRRMTALFAARHRLSLLGACVVSTARACVCACVRAFPEVGTRVPETISSLKKREKKREKQSKSNKNTRDL